MADLLDNDGAIKNQPESSSLNKGNRPFVQPNPPLPAPSSKPTAKSRDQKPVKSPIADPQSAPSSLSVPPLFPSLLSQPPASPPSVAVEDKTISSTSEEDSPLSRAKRINEELRGNFARPWDDDDDDDEKNPSVDGIAGIQEIQEPSNDVNTRVVVAKEDPSELEIQRLSETEDGEIMSEDEDEPGPKVIPMEPEFTDDEDAMDMDAPEDSMDVDMRVEAVATVAAGRRFGRY